MRPCSEQAALMRSNALPLERAAESLKKKFWGHERKKKCTISCEEEEKEEEEEDVICDQ